MQVSTDESVFRARPMEADQWGSGLPERNAMAIRGLAHTAPPDPALMEEAKRNADELGIAFGWRQIVTHTGRVVFQIGATTKRGEVWIDVQQDGDPWRDALEKLGLLDHE